MNFFIINGDDEAKKNLKRTKNKMGKTEKFNFGKKKQSESIN